MSNGINVQNTGTVLFMWFNSTALLDLFSKNPQMLNTIIRRILCLIGTENEYFWYKIIYPPPPPPKKKRSKKKKKLYLNFCYWKLTPNLFFEKGGQTG